MSPDTISLAIKVDPSSSPAWPDRPTRFISGYTRHQPASIKYSHAVCDRDLGRNALEQPWDPRGHAGLDRLTPLEWDLIGDEDDRSSEPGVIGGHAVVVTQYLRPLGPSARAPCGSRRELRGDRRRHTRSVTPHSGEDARPPDSRATIVRCREGAAARLGATSMRSIEGSARRDA